MWSAALVVGAWLAGCASEPTTRFKNLNKTFKTSQIENMNLHDLKTMSAAEIYGLSIGDLDKLRKNTPTNNPLSESNWQKILVRTDKIHPTIVFYTRIRDQTLNGCRLFKPSKMGTTLSTVFVATEISRSHPSYIAKEYEVFSNPKGVRRYVGPIRDQYQASPKNPYICVEDYKNASLVPLTESISKVNNPDLGCEVYIMVPYVSERGYISCSDVNPLSPYYTGNDHFCELKARVFEASVVCQEFEKNTFLEAD